MEWAPTEGAMTFGDLIRHLAVVERWMFVENVFGRPSRYASHGRELADGRDAVARRFFATCMRKACASSPGLPTRTSIDRRRRPAASRSPCGSGCAGMVEHEAHHRGQIYLMLRLCGVATPPIYGLTSEEVRRRAIVGFMPKKWRRSRVVGRCQPPSTPRSHQRGYARRRSRRAAAGSRRSPIVRPL